MDALKARLILGLISLVGIALAGIIILIALGRDTAQLTTFILIVLPVLGGFGITNYTQAKQADKLEVIGRNVNGNSSQLLATVATQRVQNQYLVEMLTKAGVTLDAGMVEEPMSDEDYDRIKADANKLPKHGDV